jgi:hypothetical protein
MRLAATLPRRCALLALPALNICIKSGMKGLFAQRVPLWSLIPILVCTWPSSAQAQPSAQAQSSAQAQPSAKGQPVPVRVEEGTVQGFFELRSQDGRLLASGAATQVAHGGRITSHTLFSFKDGSIDDETTVFSQQRTLHLISDRHIQKGPSFPHPMDVSVDARSGQVTVRSMGKDGKEEAKTDHLTLPPDLANGMIPVIAENLRPDAPQTTVSMVVATPKLRMVKLAITSLGEETFSVAGSAQKAIHYQIKIELGGVAGVVAPIIGKQPPDIQLWIVGGQAPTFVREQGPLYEDGPMTTIQLAGTEWRDSAKSGH